MSQDAAAPDSKTSASKTPKENSSKKRKGSLNSKFSRASCGFWIPIRIFRIRSGSWRHGFDMRCIVSARTLLISGPCATFRSTTLAASQRLEHESKFHRSFTSGVMFKALSSLSKLLKIDVGDHIMRLWLVQVYHGISWYIMVYQYINHTERLGTPIEPAARSAGTLEHRPGARPAGHFVTTVSITNCYKRIPTSCGLHVIPLFTRSMLNSHHLGSSGRPLRHV